MWSGRMAAEKGCFIDRRNESPAGAQPGRQPALIGDGPIQRDVERRGGDADAG